MIADRYSMNFEEVRTINKQKKYECRNSSSKHHTITTSSCAVPSGCGETNPYILYGGFVTSEFRKSKNIEPTYL